MADFRRLMLLLLAAACAAVAQPASSPLSSSSMESEQTRIRDALAGPDEYAFADILTDVQILRDEVADNDVVYDIVVCYDPMRYQDPHAGIYPLAFEDQFIIWGRRIALYTQRTSWSSGRFFLCEISTLRQAWILTRDARGLQHPLPATERASAKRGPMAQIHAIDGRTDLRTMGRWLRLMTDESREACQQRRRRGAVPMEAGEPRQQP